MSYFVLVRLKMNLARPSLTWVWVNLSQLGLGRTTLTMATWTDSTRPRSMPTQLDMGQTDLTRPGSERT